MLEDRKSRSSRKTPDLVTDELILILHEAGMLEFNDIFQRTVAPYSSLARYASIESLISFLALFISIVFPSFAVIYFI